ncbi:MAG: hypothetical protein E7Z63_02845 [Thermoplasmata archaeon]|nr:hypothetical protein [Thermoplasmata archaeon]
MDDIQLSPEDSSSLHCYRCGDEIGLITEMLCDDDGDIREMFLVCPHCGGFSIMFDEEEGWHVKGTDIPYVPGAFSDTAYLYSQFDEKEYPDKETALRSKLGILNTLIIECETSDSIVPTKRLHYERIRILKEAIDSGLEAFRKDYAEALFESIYSGYDTPEIRAEITEHLQYYDIRDLSLLLDSILAEENEEDPLSKTIEEMLHKTETELLDKDAVDSTKGLLELIDHYIYFDDCKKALELQDHLIICLRDAGTTESNQMIGMVCSHCLEITTDEKLDSIMSGMRKIRECCPEDYYTCSIANARRWIYDPGHLEDIKQDMMWLQNHLIPINEDPFDYDDYDSQQSIVEYVYAVASNSPEEMEKAVMDLVDYYDYYDFDTDSSWAIWDYWINRNPGKRMKKWILQRLNEEGLTLEHIRDLSTQ